MTARLVRTLPTRTSYSGMLVRNTLANEGKSEAATRKQKALTVCFLSQGGQRKFATEPLVFLHGAGYPSKMRKTAQAFGRHRQNFVNVHLSEAPGAESAKGLKE
eukprot:5889991-Pleurochrysis_carterae.AAC.1